MILQSCIYFLVGFIQRRKRVHKCISCSIAALSLVILILCVIGLILCLSHPHKSMKVLGRDNDTIYLDESGSLWYSEWSARECISPDTDYSHTTSLYRVQGGDIKFHHDDMSTSITGGPRVTPARDLGYYSLYLLEGSHINCTICLSTSSTTVENGRVFIFNDLNYYKDYLNEKSEGEETAMYLQSLPIGTASQPACTTIHFSVPNASYYFVATETPGGLGIMYQFNYTTHVVFLDHTDYDEHCYVKQPHKCTINIPNTFLKDEDYVLLGYIHPLAETTTTHICVTRGLSFLAAMVLFFIAAFILLVVLACFSVCIYHCFRNQHRHGYIPVKNDIN